jgi:hypothetical protein
MWVKKIKADGIYIDNKTGEKLDIVIGEEWIDTPEGRNVGCVEINDESEIEQALDVSKDLADVLEYVEAKPVDELKTMVEEIKIVKAVKPIKITPIEPINPVKIKL